MLFLVSGLRPAPHLNHNVRHPALVTVSPAHRSRTHALHARTVIDVRLGDEQLVDIHVVVAIFRVGNRRAQHFLHRRRDALVGGAQNVDRGPSLTYASVTNSLSTSTSLLRFSA